MGKPGKLDTSKNIDSDSDSSIQAALTVQLSAGEWDAVEAWMQGKLVSRIVRRGKRNAARLLGSLA